jgi:hypothetical protein
MRFQGLVDTCQLSGGTVCCDVVSVRVKTFIATPSTLPSTSDNFLSEGSTNGEEFYWCHELLHLLF